MYDLTSLPRARALATANEDDETSQMQEPTRPHSHSENRIGLFLNSLDAFANAFDMRVYSATFVTARLRDGGNGLTSVYVFFDEVIEGNCERC